MSPEALLRGIPVVASDSAGLKESTLSVAHLIPVQPPSFSGPKSAGGMRQLCSPNARDAPSYSRASRCSWSPATSRATRSRQRALRHDGSRLRP